MTPVRWMADASTLLLIGAALFGAAVLAPGVRAMPPADAARLLGSAAARLRRLTQAAAVGLLLGLALGPLDWTAFLRMGLAALLLLPPTPRATRLQAAVAVWVGIVAVLIAVVGGPPHAGSVQFLYVVLPSVVYGLIVALATLILPLVPDVRLPTFSWAPAALAVCLGVGTALASHAAHPGPLGLAAGAVLALSGACSAGGLAALLTVVLGEASAHRIETARVLTPRLLILIGVSVMILLAIGVQTAPRLPTLNAGLNALSATLAAAAYLAIRRKQIQRHRRLMLSALGASVLFLISYLYYHAQVGATRFAGEGWARAAYLAILGTHTALAAVIVPLVAVTLHRALTGRFPLHKRLARITLPLWLYVSVTGVIVYLMLYRLSPSR